MTRRERSSVADTREAPACCGSRTTSASRRSRGRWRRCWLPPDRLKSSRRDSERIAIGRPRGSVEPPGVGARGAQRVDTCASAPAGVDQRHGCSRRPGPAGPVLAAAGLITASTSRVGLQPTISLLATEVIRCASVAVRACDPQLVVAITSVRRTPLHRDRDRPPPPGRQAIFRRATASGRSARMPGITEVDETAGRAVQHVEGPLRYEGEDAVALERFGVDGQRRTRRHGREPACPTARGNHGRRERPGRRRRAAPCKSHAAPTRPASGLPDQDLRIRGHGLGRDRPIKNFAILHSAS